MQLSREALLETRTLDAIDTEIAAFLDRVVGRARAALPPDCQMLPTRVYVSD